MSVWVPVTSRSKFWYIEDGWLNTPLMSPDGKDVKIDAFPGIKLDDVLGVKNGHFDVSPDASGLISSGKSMSLKIGQDFVLHAQLQDDMGDWHPRQLNMSFFIFAKDKSVEFKSPSTNIKISGGAFILEGTKIKGICLASDGLLHDTEYDLTKFLDNKNGAFVARDEADGLGGYAISGNNFALDENDIILTGKLKNDADDEVNAAIDLSLHLSNIDGQLQFKPPQGPWDRDGAWTQFAETFPYVSWAVVAAHLVSGNIDQAKRAAARSLYALIVFASCTAGGIVGNGLGISMGAALGTAAAMKIEELVASTIVDPQVAAQIDPATLERYFKEVLVNAAAGKVGGVLSKRAARFGGSYVSDAIEGMTKKAMDGAKRKIITDATEQGLSFTSGPSLAYRTNDFVIILDNIGQELGEPRLEIKS
ncbi:hypothetical protein Dda_9013 [Drechslerella dactyloides]|uniref:Cyanovirin-N domain-containing protein n=1 Tax=Drechslerella dactyloides TaxID=74499 RepID=A0AAD6NGX7_DREDA|nr:hypothetical protein Dda_9013 [Drechslerella dactyloides]